MMAKTRVISKTFLLAAGLAYLATPAMQSLMKPGPSLGSAQSEVQRQKGNTSAFAVMLGEFRTSLGDILFIKTERYLDSGIGYEPHVDARQMASTGSSKDAEAETSMETHVASSEMQEAAGVKPGSVHVESHDHDHSAHDDHSHDEHVQTLIKPANSDFRGFIGTLERKVKPWRDPSSPHHHTAGTELLPWYRLATLSDPHNVRNYMIGAWWLKTLRTQEQRDEAIKFLNEGIAANPDAYELYLMKGYVLREMGQLENSRENFEKSATLGIKARPANPTDEKNQKPGERAWDTTDDEQLHAAVTMQIMLTRDLESTSTAQALTESYMKKMSDNGFLTRIQNSLHSGN